MLLSFNWLKKYVNLPDSISAEEVAEKLKLSTVEVEKVEHPGKNLENVVVGKIISCEKHPNADKLKVCQVSLGNENVTIVCGGSNVATGMLVAVAKTGAKVKWHGEGELVELKPTAIRGVESNGMICASDEIGLSEMFPKKEEKEILDLSAVIPTKVGIQGGVDSRLRGNDNMVGKALTEVLNLTDAILEIDNKSLSNRPDLWGHYGMAREVAVLFNRDVAEYKTKEITEGKEMKIKVKIEDSKQCSKYMAVAMSGIKVGESPEWLKQKLAAVGLRPINNIVDITNYVMLDVGQPMHAFDAARVPNAKIFVRKAKDGEEFTTLDGKKHQLDSSTLVIANEEKAVALAGVMGGLESGINSDTGTIIFESANFDAATIRRTSTKLSLRTDSSARFEKSLDPNLCKIALQRAVELVMEVCPEAKVASKVVDEGKERLFVGPLEIPLGFFAQKLGVEIPVKTIITILERLGFAVKASKKFLSVKIPTWRATKDVAIAEDVVEEIARIYGYNQIGGSLPRFAIIPPFADERRRLERKLSDTLVKEFGYTEVYNYSFVSEAQIKKLGDDSGRYAELDNPLSKEKPFIRRNLLPNLLENVANNIVNYPALKVFEIGKVVTPEESGQRAETNGDELLPRQDTWLVAMYASKKDAAPFAEVRRIVERLTEDFRILNTKPRTEDSKPWQHPSRAAEVKSGDATIGMLYEVHPNVTHSFGVEERVGVVELNISKLVEDEKVVRTRRAYKPLPLYPEVERDIAFLVKKDAVHEMIVKSLRAVDPLLVKAKLFDIYLGEKVGEGYKSMAYRLTYAHPERTLTTQEVDTVQQKIEKMLKEKFEAEVRK